MYERMHVLGPEGLDTIHRASLQILSEVGVVFHAPEAVDLFRRRGARLTGNVVHPDERLIQQALASAPRRFPIHARDPAKTVFLGGDDLALAPAYGPVMRVDSAGVQTRAVMDDYDNLCRLVHTSPVIERDLRRYVAAGGGG